MTSLHRQLALGLSLGLTLLWLMASIGTALVLRHEMDEVFDSALRETADRILPLAVVELSGTARLTAGQVNRVTQHQEYLSYVVRNVQDQIVLRSEDADPAQFDPSGTEGFRDTDLNRIFRRSTVSGDYAIEVAEPHFHRREAVGDTIKALFAPLFLLIPLSLFGGFWLVRRALRPIDRLREDVLSRSGSDLRPVAVAGLPAELAPVALALNQLLDRMTRTLEAERSFTANSAHELRTPIAAALAHTQRLADEAQGTPHLARIAEVEAQLLRLARLSEKLMQLARAEGRGLLIDVPQNLAPVLALVVDDFRRSVSPEGPFGEGQGGQILLTLPDRPTPSRIDPDAFAILARNLIENALRHGDPAQAVQVTLAPDGSLTVANHGAVIPPDTLATLATRFVRGKTQVSGAGLGLAIAQTIATGAQARLTLASPAPGWADGFAATLGPTKV